MFNKQQMCTSCIQQLNIKNCTDTRTPSRIESTGNLIQCIKLPLIIFWKGHQCWSSTLKMYFLLQHKCKKKQKTKHLVETNSERTTNKTKVCMICSRWFVSATLHHVRLAEHTLLYMQCSALMRGVAISKGAVTKQRQKNMFKYKLL